MDEETKAKLRDKWQKAYLDAIKDMPSIIVHEVEDVPITLYSGIKEKIDELAWKGIPKPDRVAWIKQVLKREHIWGEFIFSFGGLPFARVFLKDTYEWVEPLWYQKVLHFEFLSLDRTYLLTIVNTEECIADNCYVAYRYLRNQEEQGQTSDNLF
jgi:hypothetical protein